MPTVDQFVAEWQGKSANPDADPYGAQCVELVNEWCKENGIEEFGGNAADFVNDPHPDCDWIANTPDGVPAPGDIMVWGPWTGNQFGHTAVVVGPADTNSFRSLDQNWVGFNEMKGSPAAFVTHNYTNPAVAGWYRPHPKPVGSFSGTVDADGGAHVRVAPSTDAQIVQQPGTNPDVVDKGTVLTFDGWCHGGTPIPDAVSGQPDDRWFRIADTHHWIASAMVNGNPPDSMPALAVPQPANPPQPTQVAHDPLPPLPLTDEEVAAIVLHAGPASDGDYVNAIAVALAESGGDAHATNTEGNSPPSVDRGLFQINSYWHAEVPDSTAFDPLGAAVAAYKISNGFTDFHEWATWPAAAQAKQARAQAALSAARPYVVKPPDTKPPDVKPDPQPQEAPPVTNPVPTPDIPEPQPLVEAGITTSEWTALVTYARQLATVGTLTVVGDVAAKLGLHLSSTAVDSAAVTVGGFEVLGLIAVATYILGRSYRKKAT